MIKNILISLLIVFISLNHSQAVETKSFPFIFEKEKQQSVIMQGVEKLELLMLNKEYGGYIFNSHPSELTIDNFPVAYNSTAKVNLRIAYNSISEETKWEIADRQSIELFKPKDIVVYFGGIEGEQNSKVFLTYSDGNIFSVVQHSNGESFSISPDLQSNDILQPHYLTAGNRLEKSENPWLCMTEDEEIGSFENDIKHLSDTPLEPSKLIDVKVACEATSEFYAMFLDRDKAAAYIASVIAHSSKIYEENINVRLTISYVLIWQNAAIDPYRDENLISDKLSLMPELWENKNVDRSIVVLFASLAAQEGNVRVAGIAFGGKPGKGNVCNQKWGCCVLGIKGGVNFPTTNYSWDVNVAAHEMGHLFGAPHTHRCYWDPPIDTCVTRDQDVGDACLRTGYIPRPGTIMSYCHTTNQSRSVQLYFHELQKPLMRKAAERAECHEVVSVPYVSLLSPLGGNTYKSGDEIKIRWTYSNINTLNLRYSIDDGKTWLKIADFINASDSIFIWKTPQITNNSVRVLVYKSTDMSIYDISLVDFKINQPAISITTPKQDEEYPVNSLMNIVWSSIFVDSIKIDFSSDNGSSWIEIAKLGSENSFQWNVSNNISDKCLIRITSLDGTDLVSYSKNFKIGEPYADLIAPQDKDILCISETYKIKWEAGYVHKIYLEYSTDKGSKWQKITPVPLDPDLQEYNWTIPNRESEQVKVRIITKIDGNTVVLSELSGAAVIKECVSDIQERNIADIYLSPNPAKDYVVIQIDNRTSPRSKLQISIYNTEGRKMLFREIDNKEQNRAVKLDLSGFNTGSYFIMINISDKFLYKKFNVIK